MRFEGTSLSGWLLGKNLSPTKSCVFFFLEFKGKKKTNWNLQVVEHTVFNKLGTFQLYNLLVVLHFIFVSINYSFIQKSLDLGFINPRIIHLQMFYTLYFATPSFILAHTKKRTKKKQLVLKGSQE